MRYLHTMLRVRDLDRALDFYCNKLGLQEVRRRVDEKNQYTLVFLAAPEDEGLVEVFSANGGGVGHVFIYRSPSIPVSRPQKQERGRGRGELERFPSSSPETGATPSQRF